MRRTHYERGTWNATCFQCGSYFKALDLVKHWQGYWVCRECWEPRHPQDFAKALSEDSTPPWIQPPPPDTFILTCSFNSMSAIAGFAVADCAVAEYVSPSFDPSITD